MTTEQYFKNLSVLPPSADVVLDTDAFNEIDDQFALSYMLCSGDRLHVQAIYAAPFLNSNSTSPKDGMEKSYAEILRLLDFFSIKKPPVFKGSCNYLENETSPVLSDAARDLADRALKYSPENPLYVIAIGAITNVASAILLNPAITENIVVVWLGGHAHSFCDTREFNMSQDIAAARVIFGCGAPFVQLPCMGVVSSFSVSKPELEYWLCGKNALCTYLADAVVAAAEAYAHGKPWTRVIWDVTAVAWLLNDGDRFMHSALKKSPVPEYDFYYSFPENRRFMRYVYHINRDALFEDLFTKLQNAEVILK